MNFGYRIIVSVGLLVSVASCAAGVPPAVGAERVTLTSDVAPAGGKRIKELRAVHGKGCGFPGALGNRAGAETLLRNQAAAAGADYVQITRVQQPYAGRDCRHNEYILEGVAYLLHTGTRASNSELPIKSPPPAETGSAQGATPPPP